MAAIIFLLLALLWAAAMIPPGHWPGKGKWGHTIWTGAIWLLGVALVFWLLLGNSARPAWSH